MQIPIFAALAVACLAGFLAFRRRGFAGSPAKEIDRSYDPAPGKRFAHIWGYDDTQFEFVGEDAVQVTGNRYPVSGRPLPRFVGFVEEILGVRIKPEHLRKAAPPTTIASPLRNDAFLSEIRGLFAADQIVEDDRTRLIHSHGQLSVEEIFRIIRGVAPARVVDLVLFPREEAEVVALVKAADRHDVVLIPYGGGTNVSGALLCPVGEPRMIVSVDMCRMDRILEINPANNWAVVEAGIMGKDLELRLEKEGYTCGHIPDSIELSTLGGWIATNASGMKKNRYGNIEDVVREATLVAPSGEIRSVPVTPRSSTGIQAKSFLFGSEGCLGIITRAVIQIYPAPECRKYASYVFRDFAAGVRFLKQVEFSGAKPASLRLVNNTEFRLGRAMTPASTRREAFVSRLKERYVVGLKGFDPKRMVACTAVMEGTADLVTQQERTLAAILKKAGGLSGGSEGGKRGYRLTFAIAYIRDFLNSLDIIGETFETSTPWDRIEPITASVEKELHRLCSEYGVSGKPFLSYRISQGYPAGVCIYFTMGFSARGLEDPVKSYQEIEHRLREVILDEGGSLSHHHGVGKVRRDFVSRVHSAGAIQAMQAIKRSLDPKNVFAAGNNVFGLETPDQRK